MAGLLRYQIFLAYGVAFLAAWHALLQNENILSNWLPLSTEQVHILVYFAPLWFIVGLGVYAIVSIGIGVSNFKDCPEAAKEVDMQVKEARIELKKLGIKL